MLLGLVCALASGGDSRVGKINLILKIPLIFLFYGGNTVRALSRIG